MKKKRLKYAYIPIVATFAILFIISAVVLTAVSDQQASGISVGEESAYDDSPQSEYDFIESKDKNGVKYYIITKNTTSSTASTTSATETETTASTTSSTQKKAATTALTSAAVSSVTRVPDNSTTSENASTTKATTTKRTVARGEKIAYLTFDDGPSINTEKLLDILDQYNAKATFFVIYHKNMEKKYKAIVDRGHTIALHSYTRWIMYSSASSRKGCG